MERNRRINSHGSIKEVRIMPIYIAKSYEGKVEGVVFARSYDLAQAYWQGKGIFFHIVPRKLQ